MSWMATERHGARPAPGGLALVQELVNTHDVERGNEPDLLTDHTLAQEWLREAARTWSRIRGLEPPQLSLTNDGTKALRELRATINTMLAAPAGEPPPHPAATSAGRRRRTSVDLMSDAQGNLTMAPTGTDDGWLESAVWLEVILAQQAGDWERLKLCREPGCQSAFYDKSRNSSGVWHNVHTCGNIANLRASRDRKKRHSSSTNHDSNPTIP